MPGGLLQTHSAVPLSSDSFFSGSSSFLGPRSMLSFEDAKGGNGSKRPFFRSFDYEEIADEDLEEYFQQPEKKRRLTADQVRFLERSFEEENKLEPERKVQLAEDLGLQPRQVVIWFQNRRARWKTKQLEKDFEVLQSSYKSLAAEYETLLEEKGKLRAEVHSLKEKLEVKDGETESSELSAKLSQEPPQNPGMDSASDGEVSKTPTLSSKQEDICSAKSDIFDSESPHYADGSYSSLLDPSDSSYAFEPDQSDLSQDEDDKLSKNSLVTANIFPKLEDSNSCNFGFSGLDHAFWSWSY
ncbi:hypothetical protein CRG98_001640 [Punica granatum]|nr:hypothetical protein CRG98_001640 [Punica granatum]